MTGWLRSCAFLLLVVLPAACSQQQPGKTSRTIVFKHGKLFGDPEFFRDLLRRFEAENQGIQVRDETLPATTDEQHQFYVINLEGKSADFDVLSMDVIWVPEFARAGWLRDLTHMLPPRERSGFFSGPMQAVTCDEKIYALPWYIDAGVLYYRKDLLEKYGLPPPGTWEDLVQRASRIQAGEPGSYGFVWQGKQYEGLVCNVLEYLWGDGGEVLSGGRVVLDSPENRAALAFMRDLIYRYRITPESVTTAVEDSTRRTFGDGKAVFMRNWPYAWNLFEQRGSAVRGKVGIRPLPSFDGHPSASTLGGWQLGVNRFSRRPEEAERLVGYLTSPEVQKEMCIRIGYKPTRKVLYKDADLRRLQPFIAGLYPILEAARPRPVTPYYMMISQVLQPEFSAVLSRIKEPGEALREAQKQVEHILAAERSAVLRIPGGRFDPQLQACTGKAVMP